MQVNSKLKEYDSFVFDQLLWAWSRPLSPDALCLDSDSPLDSKVLQSVSSCISNEDLEIKKFSDLFEEVKTHDEQIGFLDRLLKADSSFIERFASYKGLKILGKILSHSLREGWFPVGVVGKTLICLDRVTIRPTVLKKLKINSLVEEVKNHKKAPEEIVKKANRLLIKWKGLISSVNFEGRNSPRTGLEENFNPNTNHDNVNKILIEKKPTALLGKRRNPLEDCTNRIDAVGDRKMSVDYPSYHSTFKPKYHNSLEAPKKMVKHSYVGNYSTFNEAKYNVQRTDLQQNIFNNKGYNNKNLPFLHPSTTKLHINPYDSSNIHNFQCPPLDKTLLCNNNYIQKPNVEYVKNSFQNNYKIINNQNPLDPMLQTSY